MKNIIVKSSIAILFATLIILFFYFDLKEYATLEYIKSQKDNLQDYYQRETFFMVAAFSTIYIFSTALSLPIASALTLLSGALFGFPMGLLIASFSSTIGATLSFLLSRFLIGEWIQQKYSSYMVKINQGFEKEGAFYLFALRLVPAFPFFVINILMGLLPIKIITYYFVSLVGMLPGTAVYVYAGTQLSEISSFGDIASPKLLISFTLLGLFPILSKKLLALIRKLAPLK